MNIQYQSGAIDPTGCISNGWELVKRNYWMYFGITILAMIIVGCIPVVNWFLFGPIMAGVYTCFLKEMRGEPVDFGMMFKGFEKFVPTMIVGLLQLLPTIIYQIVSWTMDIGRFIAMSQGRTGQDVATGISIASGIFGLIFLVVSIVWAITFAFAVPLVAEHNLKPMEAIRLSASAAWSNIGGLILLWILAGLLGLAGMIALCIGILFVMPIVYAAMAFSYRQVFPDMGPQNYHNAPPSPDMYGGSGTFGQGMG